MSTDSCMTAARKLAVLTPECANLAEDILDPSQEKLDEWDCAYLKHGRRKTPASLFASDYCWCGMGIDTKQVHSRGNTKARTRRTNPASQERALGGSTSTPRPLQCWTAGGSWQMTAPGSGQWTVAASLLWFAARAVALPGSDPTEACAVVSDTLPGVSCRRPATLCDLGAVVDARTAPSVRHTLHRKFGAMGGLAVQGGRVSRPRPTPKAPSPTLVAEISRLPSSTTPNPL
jgi:hypothetical protein